MWLLEKKSTCEALYNQIKEELVRLGIECKHIVGCSFDGAANMSGQYKGVQAHLKKDNPTLFYVHCNAHVLNLVIIDSTKCCKDATDFLGLVQNTSVFISESHKCMLVWSDINKEHAQ